MNVDVDDADDYADSDFNYSHDVEAADVKNNHGTSDPALSVYSSKILLLVFQI